MRGFLLFFLTGCLVACSFQSNGQANMPADTVKTPQAADTVKKTAVKAAFSQLEPTVSNKLKAMDPTKQVKALGTTLKDKGKAAAGGIADKLKGARKSTVTYDLIFGNDLLFHPLPVPGALNNQRVLNAFSIIGSVNGWIIPLNINFTTGRNINGVTPLSNSLFKFDFDNKQFTNSFKSGFEQYQDLQQTVFGGASLSTFARSAAMKKLSAEQQDTSSSLSKTKMKEFLSNPQNINMLLTMDNEQIKQKLIAAGTASAYRQVSKAKDTANKKVQTAIAKSSAIQDLSKNEALNQYVGDPANLEPLRLMTPDQVEQKLTAVANQKAADATTAGKTQQTTPKPADPAKADSVQFKVQPGFAVTFDQIVKTIEFFTGIKLARDKKNAAWKESMHKLSMDVFISSHQGNTPQLSKLLEKQQQAVNAGEKGALTGVEDKLLKKTGQAPSSPGTADPEKEELQRNAESVASSITELKKELQFKGYDIGSLLQAQQLQETGTVKGGSNESARALLNKRPGTAMQQLLTRMDALKVGSFGGKVPGNTDGQDLFLSGTAVTYKANAIPITIGYGSTNDIGSLKDADFQSSVYDPPKNVTFLGAQVNQGVFGKVNISLTSAINREVANNSYSLSTVSSNNLAFTLSKEVSIDKIGHFIFDASKSATLTNNNYIAGIQPLMDRQGGLNNDLANNLFQSLSFGVNHMLDIRALDMSDNVYFSYAGMGYQNPANTGYGGARLKFGGNIKKSFYKHKLTFSLRSDFNNMPISYTSSDKWKTYQVGLDTKYIINKKFNVSLKYSTNSTSKMIDNVSSKVYSFQKIQADGNATYKIGKYFSVSHLTISKQDFSNTYVTEDPGNMLMINYTQSVVFSKNSITANVFYNKELSPLQLIGNMLTSDLTYSYTLFNKLSMSSGVTYLDNQGIAQQAGVRQSVQVFAGKNFSLDTYVDLSKNMVTPKYPDLYSQCRAELSLKYHLTN